MKQLKWKIGDVEIYALQELTNAGPLIQSILPDAKASEVKKDSTLSPHFITRSGEFLSSVQSFLVKTTDKLILVDTCNGNGKHRTDMPDWGNLNTNFLSQFDTIGVSLDDIDIVINTHLHFDHVGWNTTKQGQDWKPTFPNATYLFPRTEYEYWTQNPVGEIEDDLRGIEDSVKPIIDAGVGEIVEDDHQIVDNIKLRPTPGHTPGHCCIEITSENEKVLIAGDLIYHPCQVTNTDWVAESDNNKELAVETREKVFREIVDTGTLFLGAHIAKPIAGVIISSGDGFAFKQI